MSSFREATVTAVEDWGPDVQSVRIEFSDGSKARAVVYRGLVGEVSVGDRVIANVKAEQLTLGSGGFHFVLWNLEREELDIPSRGHIMKLRYTPLQFNVETAEEIMDEGGLWPEDPGSILRGTPIIAGTVHSQLLPVALAFRQARPHGRLVYVMTDGGCLPIGFSHTVRFLKNEGYIARTVTCGDAFGGDLEAVNIFGALAAAKILGDASAIVVMMGPGIVGTGTPLGFTGMEQGAVLNATAGLGGRPIAIPRITFADPRDRHRGLSHHTVSVLRYGALVSALVPVPKMEPGHRDLVNSQIEDAGLTDLHDIREVDASGVLDLMEGCGFTTTVMGRGAEEEPEYFMAAGAAGLVAGRMCGK